MSVPDAFRDTPPPDPWEGRILGGRYRLEQWLGEGAAGVVYRAHHLGLKKSFAVKLLQTASPDPLSLARFGARPRPWGSCGTRTSSR